MNHQDPSELTNPGPRGYWLGKAIPHSVTLVFLSVIFLAYFFLAHDFRRTMNWEDVLFEGALLLMVLSWSLTLLPHWKTSPLLSLGILLFLGGNFADLLDEFVKLPRWMLGYLENGLLTIGAGLA
ncbi:MAG: hypothetical protein HY695_27080 [Deltaproteobacteria bacterium]|nr:hypothetical protein [Deltaproteobacteria bacterium]